MFGHSFYYIINMSIMASFVMLVILALRFLLGKCLSQSMLLMVWVIVFMRLIVPISIESPLSIGNIFSDSFIKEVKVGSEVSIKEGSPDFIFSNYIQLADDYEPLNFQSSQVTRWFDILGKIWLAGVFIMLLYFIMVYYMFRKLKNKADPVDDFEILGGSKVKCYLNDHIDTPMVVGILKPYILFPARDYDNLSHQIKKVVMTHEKAHITRKDNLWKLIFTLGLCLHWFNPFIWLMSKIISKDIEMACDEKVLKGLEENKRKDYVVALVDYASKECLHATAFGRSNLKNRVFAIINYKKKSSYMIVVTSLMCAVLAFILLTNPIN